MRAGLVIPGLLALLLGMIAPARDAPDGVRLERWYRVERDGDVIGWMSLVERAHAETIVTEATYEERVLVMGQTRHRRVFGEVHEDAGGRVLRVSRSRDQDDHLPAGAFGRPADRIESGGDRMEGLGPSAAAAFIARRLEAGARELSVVRMGPLLAGGAERLTLTGIEACTQTIGDRQIDGFCADWGADGRVMLDARGYPLIARFADGSRTVVFRATSRTEALAPYEPVESVADVLVPVAPEGWDGRGETFLVERLDGQAWDLPDVLGGFTLDVEGEKLRSTMGAPPPEGLSPAEREAALRETGLINFSQLPSVAWANDAAETRGDARVHVAQRRVHDRLLHRGFALGLADAVTAYMRREGDCTEHAVLLAALLRREHLPARIVGGLVPIEHEGRVMMAQHLWVQAYVEREGAGVWVDLDATLMPGAPLTARVPLGATGVTDETVTDLVRRMGALAGLVRVEAVAPE
jgi:hypothetical protein